MSFKTALATVAVGTATDANVTAVAEFIAFAVSSIGLGVDTVASGATPTEVGNFVTDWTATFNVNGKAANVVFSSTAATFPAGTYQYQGATQSDGTDAGTVIGDSATDPWTANATVPTASLWTAVVTVDGPDVGSTLEANERVLTMTRLVS
jgi:hypothetical protein